MLTIRQIDFPTLVDRTDSPLCSIMLRLPGSISDPVGKYGIAHFVEHLCCSSTVQTPAAARHLRQYRLGEWNAYTGRDSTTYVMKCLAENVRAAIMNIFEGVLFPAFNPDEVERERGVILQEMVQRDDQQWCRVNESMQVAVRGEQVGHRPIGYRDDVLGITVEDLRSFHAANYPGHGFLVVSGKVDPEEVDRGVVDAGAKSTGYDYLDASPFVSQSQPLCVATPHETAAVSLWAPGDSCAIEARDQYLHDLVGNAIGGGLFAPVMARLREKLGLVYGAGAFHSSQSYGGEWCLWAQTSYAKADLVISELGSIWADVLSNGVPSEVWDTAVCAFRFQKETQLIDPERRATLIASLYPALDLDEIRYALRRPFTLMRAGESFEWLRSRCRTPLSVARSVRS